MEEEYVFSGDNTYGEGQTSRESRKRLVLFYSNIPTLNLFTNQLKQGFLELGYEIYELNLSKDDGFGPFLKYVQENPVTAMIAFNNSFFGTTLSSGENMCEALGIPSINILVDHPYWYHDEILMRTPSNGIVLCVDRNHMNYVNRFYPNISCNGFLPLGGFSGYSTHKPISDRKTEVLYAGSLSTNRIPHDFSGWDFPAKQILEHLITHTEDTIEAVIEQELRQAGVILPDEELRKFISSCATLDNIVSSYYREKVVSSVAKAGIPLELYGNGWEVFDWVKLPNVHYGGCVSPEEILLMMEDSKIILNSMPWFRDGSHDRVFNAMMCGAVAVSETSKYLEEVLPADTWVSFDLSYASLADLPHRIKELLDDEERMQQIASAGYELAASEHTWKTRALELHRDLLSQL